MRFKAGQGQSGLENSREAGNFSGQHTTTSEVSDFNFYLREARRTFN
jgi:hypothetical protein